mgnify:CR=1 FL=1
MDAIAVVGALSVGMLAACVAEIVRGRPGGFLANVAAGLGGAFIGAVLAALFGLGLSGFWVSFALSSACAATLLTFVDIRRAR